MGLPSTRMSLVSEISVTGVSTIFPSNDILPAAIIRSISRREAAPTFPESISEGTVAVWHKRPGEQVSRDDLLVDIETDKVVLEIVAPRDGALTDIVKDEGEIVESDEVIAHFEAGQASSVAAVAADEPTPAAAPAASASPAARKLADESGIDISRVDGTGKAGRITKDDVSRALHSGAPQTEAQAGQPAVAPAAPFAGSSEERVERRVPMTRLRASIARRLVEAQQTAAMLTTFNEVDMSPVMTMRRKYQEEFQARHNGTRLGFMSFFVRASMRCPSAN